MKRGKGAVYVAEIKRRYKNKVYTSYLLRRVYRENGKVKQQTLGNLSALPLEAIELIRGVLRGQHYLPDDQVLQKRRTWLHGHVAAVGAMVRSLGIDQLLSPEPSEQRERLVAMIIARVVAPHTKLATTRWWQNTSLVNEPAVAEATEDDLYEAMDWLLDRQPDIERSLAARHLAEGGLVLYDLTSSYVEGSHCPLAARGHNRDGKKGKLQVNYGLLLDPQGRPVAVQVYRGNTADPKTVADQLHKIKDQYQLGHVVLVSDRGMLTSARIREIRTVEGIDWISALRAKEIQKLADGGAIPLSLFDERDLAEIDSPEFPGERLIICRNPLLAEDRARTRRELVDATEALLGRLARRVAAGQLKRADKIGQALGRIQNRYKVGKHFICEVSEGHFAFRRDEAKIKHEAALDGIYVVRTSVPAASLSTEGVVLGYKSLALAEQAFKTFKSVDIRVRPIHHRLARRVRAHILLCMLAYYVEWHLRQAWAPYLFEDEHPGRHEGDSPIRPAQRSEPALRKAATKQTPDGETVHSFHTLLELLSTVTRDEV
ncbi:MAG TPA: IS1634 family transposase [Bacillota bacterium]|nr:IS1634 family transposase [Bacillota bacterium]